MPQLAEIITETLEGTLVAIDNSQRRVLLAQLTAVRTLAETAPEQRLEVALQLLEEGYLPDFYAATQVQLDAQLTMTTARDRQQSGGGSVNFGPIRLEGSMANTFRQATTTNLAVSIQMERESKNRGIEYIHSLFPALPSA